MEEREDVRIREHDFTGNRGHRWGQVPITDFANIFARFAGTSMGTCTGTDLVYSNRRQVPFTQIVINFVRIAGTCSGTSTGTDPVYSSRQYFRPNYGNFYRGMTGTTQTLPVTLAKVSNKFLTMQEIAHKIISNLSESLIGAKPIVPPSKTLQDTLSSLI